MESSGNASEATVAAATTEEEAERKAENDLLCFVQCKMGFMPKDTMMKIMLSYYTAEQIVEARELLYRDVPDDFPRLVRHVNKKDNLSTMYDVLQRLGAVTPRRVFLCRNLNNVPPVDIKIKNVDAVMLLQQTNMVKDEMEVMKSGNEALHQQLAAIVEALGLLRQEVRTSRPSGDGSTPEVSDVEVVEEPPLPRYSDKAANPPPRREPPPKQQPRKQQPPNQQQQQQQQ